MILYLLQVVLLAFPRIRSFLFRPGTLPLHSLCFPWRIYSWFLFNTLHPASVHEFMIVYGCHTSRRDGRFPALNAPTSLTFMSPEWEVGLPITFSVIRFELFTAESLIKLYCVWSLHVIREKAETPACHFAFKSGATHARIETSIQETFRALLKIYRGLFQF